ncbi:MAG: hypothetical protein CML23_15685 [Rhizobiaceae bacterium]|nr:hypothetical protein [Rhizobiaceae bacterium]
MSQETRGEARSRPNTQRPLPPEIKFNAANGSLYGTVEPGQIVKMKNNINEQVHKCFSNSEGQWLIPNKKPAQHYTLYRIWVCDPDTGAESDTINFMYGARCPQLKDAYTSTSTAFGVAPAGTEIAVYGPAGQSLGTAFVFGRDGPWSIKFNETLNDGDKVCVTARYFNGNHDMPLFQKARTFSIDERYIDRIAGSGAIAGEKIMLLDAESEDLIAQATADRNGTWSVSPRTVLEDGARIATLRVDENSTATKGPDFSVTTDNCLPPSVEIVSETCIRGRANQGLRVNYTQFRDHQPVKSGVAIADGSAFWEADDLDLRPGDCVVATTATEDGLKRSLLYSSMTFGQDRPTLPHVESIQADGASGFADPGSILVASSVGRGVIAWGKAGADARWALNWTPAPLGSDEEPMLVQFTVFTSLTEFGVNAPSSCFVMSSSDSTGIPAVPTITGYTPPSGSTKGTFTGTEDMTVDGTTDTKITITVHNFSQNSVAVGRDSDYVSNNNWTVTATSPPDEGNLCFAVAHNLSSGDIGADSPRSDYFRVP